MHSIEQVKTLLADTLNLGKRIDALHAESGLLGSIPELDSMAVVNVITGLEEHFNIVIHDDEINADIFQTIGTLSAFVDSKLGR